MKKFLLSIALLLAAVGVQAQIGEFEKMGKIKGVEYHCVDRDSLRQMLESGSGIHVPGINIGTWANSLASEILPYVDCIQSIKADEAKVGKKLVKEFDKFMKDNSQDYVLLSDKEIHGAKIRVYNGVKGGSITCTDLGENVMLVAVSGEKSLTDLMGILMNKFQGRK